MIILRSSELIYYLAVYVGIIKFKAMFLSLSHVSHYACSLLPPHAVRIFDSRRMRWAGLAASMGLVRNA
jgi:hypothetical protein